MIAFISILLKLDSITEKRFSKAKRVALFVMWSLFVVLLAISVISLFTRGTAMSAEDNTRTLIDTILNFATLVFTGYTCTQIAVSKDINRVEISNYICDCDKERRKDTAKAKEQLVALAKKLAELQSTSTLSDPNALPSAASEVDPDLFQTIYTGREYETLREFAFHYEYIGFLVLRNRLDFDVVFDTISFPNWLIFSQEADQIISSGRVQTPDFWCGTSYLYRSYEVKRKYNAMKSTRGLPRDVQGRKAELQRRKAAYKAARTAWIANYRQTLG